MSIASILELSLIIVIAVILAVIMLFPFILLIWRVKVWFIKRQYLKKQKEVLKNGLKGFGQQARGIEEGIGRSEGREGFGEQSTKPTQRSRVQVSTSKTSKLHEPATF